jgi:ABC-type ATPase involved in cell division
MTIWYALVGDKGGKREIPLEVSSVEIARAAIANWLIDRPYYRLLRLADTPYETVRIKTAD